MKPTQLADIATVIGLDGLDAAFATLLGGGARRRFVVRLQEHG